MVVLLQLSLHSSETKRCVDQRMKCVRFFVHSVFIFVFSIDHIMRYAIMHVYLYTCTSFIYLLIYIWMCICTNNKYHLLGKYIYLCMYQSIKFQQNVFKLHHPICTFRAHTPDTIHTYTPRVTQTDTNTQTHTIRKFSFSLVRVFKCFQFKLLCKHKRAKP